MSQGRLHPPEPAYLNKLGSPLVNLVPYVNKQLQSTYVRLSNAIEVSCGYQYR